VLPTSSNAETYAAGKSEEEWGRAFKILGTPREEIVISTKVRLLCPGKPGSRSYQAQVELTSSVRRTPTTRPDLLWQQGRQADDQRVGLQPQAHCRGCAVLQLSSRRRQDARADSALLGTPAQVSARRSSGSSSSMLTLSWPTGRTWRLRSRRRSAPSTGASTRASPSTGRSRFASSVRAPRPRR
jgi:hypothetical protein